MAITARGGKSRLAICYESVFGTTPSSPDGILIPINSSSIAAKQNLIDPATITGRRDVVQPARGNIDVSGSVVVPIDEVSIGYWLKAMFGGTTASGELDPYTHVFKVGDSQPSLVMEQQFPDATVYELFNGCKVSKFAMSMAMNNNELTASIDIMGAKRTLGSSSFDGTLTSPVITKYSGFQGSVEEGGSAAANIVSADINIDFGLDGDMFALGGNGVRADIVEGLVTVTGTIRAFFANNTLLNKAINGTESSIKLKLANGANRSLEFYMEEVLFEQTSPAIEGSKGIMIDLPYRAYYQNGNGNSIVVATLKNGQAAY